MIEHPKVHHVASDVMALIGFAAAGISTVDQLEQGLRIIAIVLSIAFTAVALYQRLKKPKRRKMKDLFDPERLRGSADDEDGGET